MEMGALLSKLNNLIPGAVLEKAQFGRSDQTTLWVETRAILKIAEYLKQAPEAAFDWLENLSVLQIDETLVITYALEVQADENRLKARLGPAFSDYRARVPAFLPQLLPYAPPATSQVFDSRGFSLGHAIFRGRHRELMPLLGLALSYVFLYLVLRFGVMKPYLRWIVPGASGVYGLVRVIYYRLVRR